MLTKEASAIYQRPLPPNLGNPGSFCITITLGDGQKVKGMLDLGAGINLMPYNLYKQLGLGEMKPTQMRLQLADRTVRYPLGTVEDVFVGIGDLVVLADFVILDVGEPPKRGNEHTILLGRPFMATSHTLIDVTRGQMTLSVFDESVRFSLKDIQNVPSSLLGPDCSFLDVIDDCTRDLKGVQPFEEVEDDFDSNAEGVVDLCAMSIESTVDLCEMSIGPSIEPKVELNPLPSHLKYVYLEENERKPVIIFAELADHEEKELIKVLKKYEKAID